MATRIEQLKQLSVTAFRELFSSLPPPEAGTLRGIYQGTLAGPSWLRATEAPVLAATGLGGWWGKEFHHDGTAINLVLNKGVFGRKFPMALVADTSLIDGMLGLALHYSPTNPFPWPLIIDELRRLNEHIVLGMTVTRIPSLRQLALPFILQHQEHRMVPPP